METNTQELVQEELSKRDIRSFERGTMFINKEGIRRRVIGTLEKTNHDIIMITEDPKHFWTQTWTQQQFSEHAEENNWKICFDN